MRLAEIVRVSCGYGKHPVIRDVSFALEAGEMVGIVGTNGSGKTTLIRAIGGLLPYEGDVFVEQSSVKGLSARERSRRFCYIPQRSGIELDISVLEVVLMGFNPILDLFQTPTKQMKETAKKTIEAVCPGIDPDRNFRRLSEGQKQLCILARALVSASRIMLLDEPESSLDLLNRYELLSKVRQWANKEKGAIVVLHDPESALMFCDRILLMKDGVIVASLEPKTETLASMESKLSLIYQEVSLVRCYDKKHKEHLVLLKEMGSYETDE